MASFLYKSQRVGRGGKLFWMYKIRTLFSGTDKISSFASKEQYLPLGRFLRKTKLDELPSLISVLKGDMAIFGYRPDEPRTFDLYPPQIQELLIRQKPGIIDLSSLYFFSEETILQLSNDKAKTYYEQILPQKLTLRFFYFENKCLLLNIAILWITFKKIIKALFRKWRCK